MFWFLVGQGGDRSAMSMDSGEVRSRWVLDLSFLLAASLRQRVGDGQLSTVCSSPCGLVLVVSPSLTQLVAFLVTPPQNSAEITVCFV